MVTWVLTYYALNQHEVLVADNDFDAKDLILKYLHKLSQQDKELILWIEEDHYRVVLGRKLFFEASKADTQDIRTCAPAPNYDLNPNTTWFRRN